MMIDSLHDIIKRAIDLHVHVGPEVIPRKYTAPSLFLEERGKLAGCVLKNHFFPSIPAQAAEDRKDLEFYGSVVLNHFVGGLNPHAIHAAAMAVPNPIFIWFPTLHTKQFLQTSEWEVPLEWVGKPNFKSRRAREIEPVIIADGGALCENVIPVLRAIADVKGVLCTGHISWRESVMLAKAAKNLGIRKIVVTHPIYQKIDMPVDAQIEMAKMGCFIEHCYSMVSIDRLPINKIAQQIREVGPKHIVLSSDVGQTFSLSPSEALFAFASLLVQEGFSLDELSLMCCENARRVVGR